MVGEQSDYPGLARRLMASQCGDVRSLGIPVRIYPRIALAAAVVAALGVAGAAPVPGHLGELVSSAPADDLVASLTIRPGQNESRRYVVEARDAAGRLVVDVIGSDILFTF